MKQEAVAAMACCYDTKKAWVREPREEDMKQCMSCQKRVATLTLDDVGLYVCGECDDLKETSRLNKQFYQDAL